MTLPTQCWQKAPRAIPGKSNPVIQQPYSGTHADRSCGIEQLTKDEIWYGGTARGRARLSLFTWQDRSYAPPPPVGGGYDSAHLRRTRLRVAGARCTKHRAVSYICRQAKGCVGRDFADFHSALSAEIDTEGRPDTESRLVLYHVNGTLRARRMLVNRRDPGRRRTLVAGLPFRTLSYSAPGSRVSP